MKRFRNPVTALCGLLCVVGLVGGLANFYLSRSLFEADWFADRAADSFAQPSVARVIAAQTADQLIAQRRELTAYRPLLLGVLEYVIASEPVRAVVRRGASKAHAALISDSGDEILLSLGDLAVITRNALAAYPEIADRIPDQAEISLGAAQEQSLVTGFRKVMRLGASMRAIGSSGVILGLLCGCGGGLLARRRERYLFRLGLGLAIGSFLAAAVAQFGGEVAAMLAHSMIGAELLRGIWPVFLGPLAVRLLILGGLGVVLVAAVSSLLEKLDPVAATRRAISRAMGPELHPNLHLLRGAVLVTAGLLVFYFPTLILKLIVLTAGAILFFRGLQEFFVTMVRFFTSRTESDDPPPLVPDRPLTRGPVAAVGVLAALLIGTGVFWLVNQQGSGVPVTTVAGTCNGHAELCGRPLEEVAFATTHNSMAAADIADWMFPNQERGIAAQLADGVRGFLIDVHYGVPVGDRIKTILDNEEAARAKYEEALGKEGVDAALRIRDRLVGGEDGDRDVYLGHGFCELGATRFTDWLETLREFMVANTGEVVIIVIQDEGVQPTDVARCFETSGMIDLVYRGPVTSPWPTLGTMAAIGERVVVYAENDAEGVPWYHPVAGNIQETPYRFHDPSEFSNAPNRGGTEGSLLLLNNWIETAPASNPRNAEIVNAYDALLARARACQRERGMIPNLVAVDFYRSGDLVRVVDALNGLAEEGDKAVASPR